MITKKKLSLKTAFRYYFKPNILSANGSIIVTDPKGELLRDCGNSLKKKGYTIKAGGQVQRGLEALMSLGPDGLYEIETSDSKAAQDINAAIVYLYKNLNSNAKHVFLNKYPPTDILNKVHILPRKYPKVLRQLLHALFHLCLTTLLRTFQLFSFFEKDF